MLILSTVPLASASDIFRLPADADLAALSRTSETISGVMG
jgi:hypothetical protein